jgi:hypothetical protein
VFDPLRSPLGSVSPKSNHIGEASVASGIVLDHPAVASQQYTYSIDQFSSPLITADPADSSVSKYLLMDTQNLAHLHGVFLPHTHDGSDENGRFFQDTSGPQFTTSDFQTHEEALKSPSLRWESDLDESDPDRTDDEQVSDTIAVKIPDKPFHFSVSNSPKNTSNMKIVETSTVPTPAPNPSDSIKLGQINDEENALEDSDTIRVLRPILLSPDADTSLPERKITGTTRSKRLRKNPGKPLVYIQGKSKIKRQKQAPLIAHNEEIFDVIHVRPPAHQQPSNVSSLEQKVLEASQTVRRKYQHRNYVDEVLGIDAFRGDKLIAMNDEEKILKASEKLYSIYHQLGRKAEISERRNQNAMIPLAEKLGVASDTLNAGFSNYVSKRKKEINYADRILQYGNFSDVTEAGKISMFNTTYCSILKQSKRPAAKYEIDDVKYLNVVTPVASKIGVSPQALFQGYIKHLSTLVFPGKSADQFNKTSHALASDM